MCRMSGNKYAYVNILKVTAITSEIESPRVRKIRLIFPSRKFVPNAFSHQIFFAHFIRTSCYVKHITGNFYRLHSSGIMLAITGDLGGMQDEWGSVLGICNWSTDSCFFFLHNTLLQNPCQSSSLWNKEFALQLTTKAKKKKKKDMAPPVPSVFSAGNRPMALLKQWHHTPRVK